MGSAMVGELAAQLDDLVRDVPGVSTLYRSTSTLSGVVTAAVSTLRSSSADEPLVIVKEEDGDLIISATIGTETESATATCRTVHDTIVDYLSGLGREGSIVKVTVGHVVE